MPSTVQSTITSQVSVTSENDSTSSGITSASSTEVFLGYADGSADNSNELTLTLTGDAAAFGQNTLADLAIAAILVGGNSASLVDASIDATALALSSGEAVFAEATAAIGYFGGSGERVLYIAHTSSTSWDEVDLDAILSTASASLVIIDPGSMPSSVGGAAAELPAYLPGNADSTQSAGCECDDPSVLLLDFEGNLATFAVDVAAFGSDTVADLNVDAVVVADEFSTVVVFVELASA